MTLALVAGALALRLAIGVLDPRVPPHVTFYAATLCTAMVAGYPAGILATVLGYAVAWWAFGAMLPAAFGPGGTILYALLSALILWFADQYRRLAAGVREREIAADRQRRLLKAENGVLASIASDRPLSETLELLTRSIEDAADHTVLASVLLLDADGERLRHGAAPSLPQDFTAAIDGSRIGPSAGSCGTAAYRREAVYVTDIFSDPLWDDYRHLLEGRGLLACWSTPIMSKTGVVLGTFALYHREPRSPMALELEIVDLLVKTAAVAIEHERGRAQRELLVQELSHRMKNTLAVVLSIASSTIRKNTDDASFRDFEQRLQALAQVQSLLTQTEWASVEFRDLLEAVGVGPFGTRPECFELTGPATSLPANLTLPFALLIHELCTNAAKYGALSNDAGRVMVEWGYADAPGREGSFFFHWTEAGGPPVRPPARQGFGSRMITHTLANGLGGEANLMYPPEGLRCEIVLPAAQVPRADGRQAGAARH